MIYGGLGKKGGGLLSGPRSVVLRLSNLSDTGEIVSFPRQRHSWGCLPPCLGQLED